LLLCKISLSADEYRYDSKLKMIAGSRTHADCYKNETGNI